MSSARLPALLLLGALAAGCAAPSPRTGRGAAGAGPAESAPVTDCTPLEGSGSPGSLAALMRDAINPRLSYLSLLLFHPPAELSEPARHDEIAGHSARLASCFAVVNNFNLGRGEGGREFEMYALLGRHNALSLRHASYQQDRRAEEHWFIHLKETCQACHEQFRPELAGVRRTPP